jgi:putative two-component system response regulator
MINSDRQAPLHKEDAMPITGANTKVLVVEDEITQRRILQAKLQKEGYQVIEAVDGRQGLQAFLDDPEIRLVLTDLSMPEMDGYQLIQALRENESHYTYIIVLTANDDKGSLVKALSLGADDYLTKPVCQNELSIRMVGGRRLLRLEGQDEIIMAMVKMAGARSDETGTHLDRVRAYTKILALDLCTTNPELKLNRSWAEDVARVSPLHDIGKVAIADDILKKPGRLTEEAMELMKTHTTIGGDILQEIHKRTGSSYLKLAYEVARCHHEKWDGSGYPEGLQGNAIPLAARIIALADTFDALTTKRCYKEAFPYEKAKSIILEGRGGHFDPMVLDAYLRHEAEWLAELNRYQ